MNEKTITIMHVSGKYQLDVPVGKINEIKEHINKCITGEQSAFTNIDDDGNISIYPASLLKNSFISITYKK